MKKYIILITIFLFLFNLGCAKKESDQFKDTVNKYNKALEIALKSSNAEIVSDITSEREKGRVEITISQFDLNNQYMDSKQKSIKFLESRKLSDKEADAERKRNPSGQVQGAKNPMAQVKTDELWEYTNYDKKTNQAVSKLSQVRYLTTYILEYRDKKWIINDIIFSVKN